MAFAKSLSSTQRALPIAEIRDEVVILKDGSLRAVLAVASVNFSLKSDTEQEATIAAYVQFLNSLEHPLQILIQSRVLNLDNYLKRLEEAQKIQDNELLRLQIADYRSFIQDLVSLGQIMSKRFLVVVPYVPFSDKRKNFWVRTSEILHPVFTLTLKEERFRNYRAALLQRVAHVQTGLASMGIPSQQLDTPALIELYYKTYNPDLAEVQKMTELSELRVE